MRTSSERSPAPRPGYRKTRRRALALLAPALLSLGLLTAPRPARAEGPGLRPAGAPIVFHPGIAVGVGYDSNLFYASNTADDLAQGAFYLALRPGFDLATLSTQRGGDVPHDVDFRLHAGLPMRFLLSNNSDVNGHYSIGVDAGAQLTINPFGEWVFAAFDSFVRTSEPPYAVVKAAFVDALGKNLNSDQNQLGARLSFSPGGHRFETSLQGVFGLYFFENAALAGKNSYFGDFQLRFKWKFFPKTAVYVNAGETINFYQNQSTTNAPPTAFPFRVVAGLVGLITAKLKVDLSIGYGNSFTQANVHYPTNNSYSSVIALVDFEWHPTTLTFLSVGYRHDFAQALIGTYYDLNSAYIGFSQLFFSRFSLGLRGAWERRGYNGDLGPDGLAPGRTDDILALHAEIDVAAKDYLIFSLGNDLTKNLSNCHFLGDKPGPPCDYLRDDVWLRATFAY